MDTSLNFSFGSDPARLQHGGPWQDLTLDLTSSLQGLLPQYLVRWAARSLQPGGRLTISAPDSRDDVVFIGRRWSFQALTQVVAKATDDLGSMDVVDLSERRIVFQRHAPKLGRGPWTAGVIFGGDAREMPVLTRCVDSLRRQPEVAQGGQLIVCGPAAAAHHITALGSDVEYLAYDQVGGAGRFLVGRKKNHVIQHARHERVLVCHARITLDDGALGRLPAEFDLITPAVTIKGAQGDLPYLDLFSLRMRIGDPCASGARPMLFYDRRQWLQQTREGMPYVDGGLFCVRRSLALAHPLSEAVAWGEAEDAEWCQRLLTAGRLVELDPDAHARSQTCKTPGYERRGHLAAYRLAVKGMRWMEQWRNR